MVIFHASALGVIMSPHSQRACATLLQTNHYAVGERCGSATGSLRQYRGESSKSWRLINDLYHIAGMVELYVTLTGAGIYVLLGSEINDVKIHGDAWGVKRLISLALKHWKASIQRFRDSWLV